MNQNDRHENGLSTEATSLTEQNEPRPDITPYAMAFIQCKAKQLVGKCGIQRWDRDDIEQELYLDLWQRLDKFNGEKAKLNTFVQLVVENKIADLLRERCNDKVIAERTALSLSIPLEEDPLTREMMTFEDSITNDQYDEFVRNKTRCREEERDLAMDIQEILSKLPEYARRPCELLMEGRSCEEIAPLVGMKSTTFCRQIIEPLREVFREANLEIYSKNFSFSGGKSHCTG